MSANQFETLGQDFLDTLRNTLEFNPYERIPEYSNQKSELPLTRRERRALKRKEKKYGNTK